MSTVTHSQALGSASETIAAASFPVQDDTHASVSQQSDPTSALAIEVLHGRMGCAVYLNDEQQLLLCEELPCAFAFDDRDPVSAARDIGPLSENPEPEVAAAVIGNNIPAFGHPSYGLVGSCEHNFPGVIFQILSPLNILPHHFENSVISVSSRTRRSVF